MDDRSQLAVLLVEDDTALASVYAELLRSDSEIGTVDTLNTGQAACEHLDDTYDVIVLDRQLDDMSGEAVVEYSRSNDIEVGIVIVSGFDQDENDPVDCDVYLKKPVKRADLIDAIDAVVSRRTPPQDPPAQPSN